MFGKVFRSHNKVNLVEKSISELALTLLKKGSCEAFKSHAKAVAKNHKSTDPKLFKRYFLHKLPFPSEYDERKLGLGEWLSYCQAAIFEILYNIPDKALTIVRDTAWGEYDWTQGNAIETLIRWASEGFNKSEIIAELKSELPHIRDEAMQYALGPLVPQISQNKELANVFEQLMHIYDVGWVYYSARQKNKTFPPSIEEIEIAQERLGFTFPEDYIAFLVSGHRMGDCEKNALEITPELKYYDIYKTRADLRQSQNLPQDLLPIFKELPNFYCLQTDGKVSLWSPNGLTDKTWSTFEIWRTHMIKSVVY